MRYYFFNVLIKLLRGIGLACGRQSKRSRRRNWPRTDHERLPLHLVSRSWKSKPKPPQSCTQNICRYAFVHFLVLSVASVLCFISDFSTFILSLNLSRCPLSSWTMVRHVHVPILSRLFRSVDHLFIHLIFFPAFISTCSLFFSEAMLWLEGKRALEVGAEIRGLRTYNQIAM